MQFKFQFLESVKLVNSVFDACCAESVAGNDFDAANLLVGVTERDEVGYYQRRNITDSLNALKKMRLITSEIRPGYTSSLRLLKEVRYYKVTSLGRLFGKMPHFMRWSWIILSFFGKKILSLLGALAFIPSVRNAYKGVEMLTGWWDSVASVVIALIVYIVILRLISK